ncbi:MAG: hypothetical protein FJX56_03245 [Alphaproteobacteria bacterium]|nr:hypothetical protein [Alphaproteobacteria bacterium]
MAIVDPESIGRQGSHPATAQRFIALEQTIAEIAGKVAAGQALRPEVRERKPAAKATDDGGLESGPGWSRGDYNTEANGR